MQGLLSLWSWGASPFLFGCVHPSGKLSKPHSIGILWRLPHIRSIINSHFQPLSHLRMKAGTENSKLLIMVWSFWGPVSNQDPTPESPQ